MASITIQTGGTFAVGETVGVYPADRFDSTPVGPPPGPQVTSAVVASDGTLTFTGLTEDTSYFAYAGGPPRYIRFRADQFSDSGTQGVYRGAWAANTLYRANDIVSQAGGLYSATMDFQSGAVFNAANWAALSAGGGGSAAGTILPWATATAYVTGQAVTNGGKTYLAVDNHTSGATFSGDSAHWTQLPVGLSNVDNTSDANKPVSTAQAAALALKVDAAAALPGSTPIDGLQMLVFGDSYATGVGASNGWGFMQRLAARFSFKSVNNRAVTGKTSWYESNVEVSSDISYMNTATLGIMSNTAYNDAADAETGAYGGSAGSPQLKAVEKFKCSKSFLIALIRRLGSAILDTAGTYSGTWTANTGDFASISFSNASASTSHKTTTQNDSVTFSGLVAGGKYAVILQAIDDNTNAQGGAAFSITATGMTTITGTTSNKFLQGRDSGITRGPMPVIVQLPAGVTALTITKTDATGTVLYVNAVLRQQLPGTSNWTLLIKQAYTPSIANTTTDLFTAALDTVVAQHGGGAEVIVIDPNANGWDKTTMISTSDNIHPNDKGHSFLLRAIANAAATATFGSQRNTV